MRPGLLLLQTANPAHSFTARGIPGMHSSNTVQSFPFTLKGQFKRGHAENPLLKLKTGSKTRSKSVYFFKIYLIQNVKIN